MIHVGDIAVASLCSTETDSSSNPHRLDGNNHTKTVCDRKAHICVFDILPALTFYEQRINVEFALKRANKVLKDERSLCFSEALNIF